MACYPVDYDKTVSELLQAPTTEPVKKRKKIKVQYFIVFTITLLASATLSVLGTLWTNYMLTFGGLALTLTAAVSLSEINSRS
jgi:hypothetical protein